MTNDVLLTLATAASLAALQNSVISSENEIGAGRQEGDGSN